MNEQNLKPVRTKSEARERGRKGGIESGRVRSLYARARVVADANITDEDLVDAIVTLKKRAKNDIRALELLMKITGLLKDQSATINQQINVDGTQSLSIREARAKLLGLDESNDNDKQ